MGENGGIIERIELNVDFLSDKHIIFLDDRVNSDDLFSDDGKIECPMVILASLPGADTKHRQDAISLL